MDAYPEVICRMKLLRPIAVLGALVSVCALALSLSGQSRVNSSGTGGVNTIKGQIFTPGNKRADGQVTVRLQNLTIGNELTLITDQSGGFEFRSLSAGTYTVVVDAGDAFELARESVTIDPDIRQNFPGSIPLPPSPKIYNVPVYLQLKHNASERNGVLNAKLAQMPKEAVRHYEKGLDLVQTGRSDDALSEFKQAVAIYPALSPAYVEMGKIYLKTSRMDDAVAALSLAIKYEPNDFDTTLDYAIALYGKRDFVTAEPQFDKAAQLNAAAVTPHYYLGLLFIQTKKLERAQAELETAKRLKGDKNFPLLHRYLGGVYVARNLNRQAVAELEIYLALAPDTKDADRIRHTIADLKAKTN
jgi:tetratricopeptide (TPR) repeat protein